MKMARSTDNQCFFLLHVIGCLMLSVYAVVTGAEAPQETLMGMDVSSTWNPEYRYRISVSLGSLACYFKKHSMNVRLSH